MSDAPIPEAPSEAPSKVVERPSPLTGIARGAIALIAVVIAVGRDFLETPGDVDTRLLVMAGIALVVIVLIGLGGVVTWRTTTFIADDEEFRVERNFIWRSSSRVDYTKVQSIDVTQPFVARLLGLAKVHIDVGGEGGVSLSYLTRRRAEALREHLLVKMAASRDEAGVRGPGGASGTDAHPTAEADDELVVAVSPATLIVGSLVTLGTISAIVGGALLIGLSVLSEATVTFVAGLIAIGGWVWGRIGKNWGFRMTRRDGALRIHRGALSKTNQGLRPGRVQGVVISQDLLQRLTGMYEMRVTVLGYASGDSDSDGGSNAVVLPAGTAADVQRVLSALWPELDLTTVAVHGQPPAARWLTPITFPTHTWGIGEHVIIAEHGLLEHRRTIVPHRRMQSASVHQGPLQRRLGLATLAVHTTDGPVDLEIYHLAERDARRLLQAQVERARWARQAAAAIATAADADEGTATPIPPSAAASTVAPAVPPGAATPEGRTGFEATEGEPLR